MESQKKQILTHLLSGKSITPMEALTSFGSFRLAARIFELRDDGHEIKTVMNRTPSGKPYAVYTLEND
jgi:hypothetical protein